MASSQRRRDRALQIADRDLVRIGAEIRASRRNSGVSLRVAAASVGIDYGTLSRIERDELDNVTVRQLALSCAAAGLDLRLQAYLAGDAPRDAGQLRLLGRLHARFPLDSPWATEVPMPIAGDLRALDGWTKVEGRTVGIEAETRLGDVQAISRKALLKQRDAGLDVMILLVASTPFNREVLAMHRDALRAMFPLDTRAVLRALSAGRAPEANGIVIL
jgi:transcriptional regulator with XRE-family HTH domain